MRLLLLLGCLGCLGGCGVDSTRSMWCQTWAEPHGSAFGYGARRTGEVAAKTVLTPATVTVDVVTDPLTWECVLVVAEATVRCCGECCCR